MEYVRGTVLRDLMHERKISTPEAIGYAEGILTALEFSHRAGIIHRDIKSANVMVTDTGLVKVMDFGIARTVSEGSATQAHTSGIVGTAQYFSPEQARGESVDKRTDLYSTGVVLYEMLAGRPPFTGETAVSVAYQHVSEAATPPSVFNPELSAALDRVVLRALAKDRNERFQSAEEFREELLAASLDPNAANPQAQEQPAPTNETSESSSTFEELLGEDFFTPEVLPTAPEETLSPPTEAFTPTTDTNPFATIGVEFEDIESDETPKPPRGSNQSQRPSPGLLWGIGSGVGVVLVGLLVWLFAFGGAGNLNFHPSEGGTPVAAVTGLTFDGAKAQLEAQKLVVSEQFEPSATVESGLVIRTDPPAGTKVADGTLVILFVSSGKTQVSVPDLSGMTEAEAQTALENAQLKLGTITEGNSASVAKGAVLSTDPPTGTQVGQGSVVNLLISSGLVTVPDVVNKNLSDAIRILEGPDVNLVVTTSSQQACPNNAAPLGVVVLQQSIPAGNVAAGSAITIYVSCTQ
jgi:serine/threonine-protein kinase